MVIVSASKNLPNSKKKAAATTSSNKTRDNARNTKAFARPVIRTTAIGAGRGKIKTTRNNTLPLPSPKSGLINPNGPRIHAQRKFAQGATAVFNNTGLSSIHSSFSPTVTPTKDGSKFRKRVLTPISPPLKRPKTEDFLTFLCFRGTPALPPELDFFNYSQPIEDVHVPTKRSNKESVSADACGGSNYADNSQNSIPAQANHSIGTAIPHLANSGASKINSKSADVAASVAANRNRSGISAKSESSANGVKVSKVAKKATAPQISPSASRINEQDARFAMTALKLKYQEKRLANARPAKSLITLLTKKVKERSMVLTRSRAKTAVGPLKTSPIKRKLTKPPTLIRPPVKPLPSRNAPSPDIILGVAHSPVKPADSRRSSSSESESASESKKSSSSSESSSSSSESEEEEPATRSLRSGKEVVMKPKVVIKHAIRKKAAPSRRIGTRATHRSTKSPLRELPMWNVVVKKKKILAKYKKNAKAKATAKNAVKKPEEPTTSKNHVTRSSLKKSSGFTKGRPSRKTKETAAIYLGLLNKDFSSDDEQSGNETDENDKASSVGDTSSSETKFLEKQYNASLKRTSTKHRSASSNRLRSQQSNSSSKKVSVSSSKTKPSSKPSEKSNEKKSQPNTKKSKESPMPRILRSQSSGSVDIDNSKNESSTAKRRLMMMTCGKDTAGAARKSAKIVSRGRVRHYSSSSEGGSHESSSDMEEEEDEVEDESKSESHSDEESNVNSAPANVKRSVTASPMSIPSSRGSKAKSKRVTELIRENRSEKSPSSISSSSGSPVDHKSESEESKSVASEMRRLVVQQQTESRDEDEIDEDFESTASVSVHESLKNNDMEVEEHNNMSAAEGHHSDSTSPVESSSSSSEESQEEDEDEATEPPQKTDIAIQVDMDLEEEEEENRRKAEESTPAPIYLPLSEEQEAELQQAQEEDDEIQEIGQVINNPRAIKSNARRVSPSRSPVTEQPQHIPIHQQSGPFSHSHVVPPPMPPMGSRTSSLTYTSHHINLEGPPVPFVPYSRPSTDFYPHLHFGPTTHLVNSVHLVGSSAGHGVNFGGELANPLSTLSIPVSLPALPSFPNSLLPPAPPLCLGPGATMTATSLQTHIRTVATNLDIPLVRPVIGSDASMSLPFGMGHAPQLGPIPLLGAPPPHVAGLMNNFFPRPLGPWSQAPTDNRHHHYSAFRLPTFHPTSIPTSSYGGTKEATRPPTSSSLHLPVSIVPPRTVPNQQHHAQPAAGQQLPARTPLHPHGISSTHVHNSMREGHHSSSAGSSYMRNYNPESIIRSLPNVSIVPKFDRSSVKTQLPPQQPSSSTSTHKKQTSIKTEEVNKSGKKKKGSTLPDPSSPLTVRKDTANPATYIGLSSKLKKKVNVKEAATASTHDKQEAATSSKDSHQFDKLLQLKQEPGYRKDVTSSSSKSKQSSSKERNYTPVALPVALENIKQETPPTKKPQSPSLHRKTPDRPSSSGSANSGSGSKSSAEEKRTGANSSSKKSSNKMLEAPTYHPSEQDFEDPLKYFSKIQAEAEKFGMARIVPPRSFRPECNVNDDMRFTAYNHYIHKMFKRWGPTVHETEAMKEHLKHSEVDVSSVPVIGGMEIDFSTLYQTVQSFGGLKEVMDKEKWADVAERLHIPKGTHDRASKLDAVYVKYILPYDLLSKDERNNLKKQVQGKWNRRQQKLQERTDESSEDETSDEDSMDELDDCVVKGKGTPLSSYYRVARNTVAMIFPNGKEPPISDLEDEYWKIVREGKKHLCVYSGSIDCAGVGWGFPAPKATAKHPWNLKVLANNTGSVLRSMGPVMGATVPTLHVSMLFTSYCWYRDPHGLPWVEYLHSGASKIWYSVAALHEQNFRKALMKLMPVQCKNKKLWLPSDSAMVPPELLLENDVPLVRAVQNPGEFLVVFPKSYTSAICGGYLVSESVCFAPPVWLKSCMETFKEIRDSKEPPVFPIEQLLQSIIKDNKASPQVLKMAVPLAEKVLQEELALRKKLISLGVSQGGKPNRNNSGKGMSKKKRLSTEEEVEQCYFCNYILHMSLVRNDRTDFVTCLHHAIQHLSRHKAQIKKCTLLCEDTQDELECHLQTAKRRANS